MKLDKLLPIILAGGKGTRLRPITFNIPKPMVKLNNKSLLEIKINNLEKAGFKEVVVIVDYLKNKIINYFKERDYGIRIKFVDGGKDYVGESSAYYAKDFFEKKNYEHLLMLSGDKILSLEQYEKIINPFKENNDLSMIHAGVKKKELKKCNISINKAAKIPESNLYYTGINIYSSQYFKKIEKYSELNGKEYQWYKALYDWKQENPDTIIVHIGSLIHIDTEEQLKNSKSIY